MMNKLNVQLAISCTLTIAGLVLLFLGFYAPPTGEIDHSVLVAFGEISTFAGALFGVDYTYRFRNFRKKCDEKESDAADSH